MSVSRKRASRSQGLTLIEVMVTLVILLLGLLGLSGLIIKSGRLSYEAYERQQALAIANDLAERMRSNQASGVTTPANSDIAGLYAAKAAPGSPLGDPALARMWNSMQARAIKDCSAGVSCNSTELVDYDLANWEGLLIGAAKTNAANVRIGSIVNARGCVEGPLALGASTPANTYRITVAWQGDQRVPMVGGNADDLRKATDCAKGTYFTADNTADAADEYRRLVVLYVSTYRPL